MISEPALDRLAEMFRQPDVSGTRYEILGELGRGGMGVVYLARDTALDREVALKVVDRPSGAATEARIIARLEHPGIVPVHDCGELPDGRLFYAMKRVRGDRLDRWMASAHDLSERLGVFLRVSEAVAFAHAHGVIHRDLKPENVMVGEFGEVLVLDWGIESVIGTPPYMAPEQERRDTTVDHRADVFALGAMLEQIAAGAVPIAAIAAKAQSAEPLARYQSVAALAADVNRFLAGHAVEAHRERAIDWLARVGRRYRLPILLVITYLAVRMLLLWFAPT
jgi:serine/threonine protein kinase